jgi:hypothetical protein
MKIEATEAFERALRALSQPDFDVVASALRKLPDAFGRPHTHSGMRKLRGQVYELRAGLDRRILFRKERDRLFLLLLGNHDQIRRFLKNL